MELCLTIGSFSNLVDGGHDLARFKILLWLCCRYHFFLHLSHFCRFWKEDFDLPVARFPSAQDKVAKGLE